jgi:hypothetical protein
MKMFENEKIKSVHCELSGEVATLKDLKVLTKIDGIINLKLFVNPKIDWNNKVINSDKLPPVKFYSEIEIPEYLKHFCTNLFSFVDDETQIEKSTHIISQESELSYMSKKIMNIIPYLESYEKIQFSKSAFWVVKNVLLDKLNCENCNIEYNSIGIKYRSSKINKIEIEKQNIKGLNLNKGYDLAVTDCCDKYPNGTVYFYKVDFNMTPINLCSNECAVDFCDKNNSLVFIKDNLIDGNVRVLCKHTKDINLNLENEYLYRSIKI